MEQGGETAILLARANEAWSPDLKADVATIILAAKRRAALPERLYRIFRLLCPFSDGNARCGRALYVWQTLRLGVVDGNGTVIRAQVRQTQDGALATPPRARR